MKMKDVCDLVGRVEIRKYYNVGKQRSMMHSENVGFLLDFSGHLVRKFLSLDGMYCGFAL